MARVAWLAVVSLAAWGAKEWSGPVGPESVWQAGAEALPEMRKACESAGDTGLVNCIAREIAKRAPAPAAEFSRAIHGAGWMSAFRRVGRVDVAYVLYPLRGNGNDGWLLVNGSPPWFDVDDLKRLPKDETKSALQPGATLFPGERRDSLYPLSIVRPDGSQSFIVEYKVTDGCQSCALLGWAFFAFEFNPKGKYVYSHFVEFVSAASEEGKSGSPPWPVQARSGEKFAIALRSGVPWSLEDPPANWIVRDAGGSGGEVPKWNFDVVGGGTTKLILRSGTDELPVKVIAAPGLKR